jgi:hypothetical protein
MYCKCGRLNCFICCPSGDWGITRGEWEELTHGETVEWLLKLCAWDKLGRPGRRPGVAHTEWGINSKPYRVDEHGQTQQQGSCAIQ